MNQERWKQYIIAAVRASDNDAIEKLSALLEEVDIAKQVLRDKGYGCIGMGILDTSLQVADINSRGDRPLTTSFNIEEQ